MVVPSDQYYHFFVITSTLSYFLLNFKFQIPRNGDSGLDPEPYLHFVMLLQHSWGIESYSRWMFSIHKSERENQCWSGAVVLHSSSALVRNDCKGDLSSTCLSSTLWQRQDMSQHWGMCNPFSENACWHCWFGSCIPSTPECSGFHVIHLQCPGKGKGSQQYLSIPEMRRQVI